MSVLGSAWSTKGDRNPPAGVCGDGDDREMAPEGHLTIGFGALLLAGMWRHELE